MTIFTTGGGNTPLTPDEQADLIPDDDVDAVLQEHRLEQLALRVGRPVCAPG